MKRFSLRTKLILMVAGVLALAILAADFMIRDLFYRNVLDQKMTIVDILTASLVHDIRYNYDIRESGDVAGVIRKYITYYRIIRGISYYDTRLVNIADSDPLNVGNVAQNEDIKAAVLMARPSITVMQFDRDSLGIRSIAPILRGSRIVGAVVMDLSIQDIEASLSTIDRHIGMILILTVLVASVILFVMLRSSILVRLGQLINVTREIATGNYEIRVGDKHKDEIGQLSQAFDQMAADLQKSKQELDNYHAKNLEKKIRELKKAYEKLKNAQTQLVLNEKMASLGTLIAGVAHEINTPLGAISNVSRNIENRINTLPQLLLSFKECAEIPSDLISTCLKDIIETSEGAHQFPSYKETRVIEDFLREQGIANWREMANALTNLNFVDVEKINKYLDCFQNLELFRLVETLGSVAQAAKISETSYNKIQEIVSALKYYAYTDRGKVEMIKISDSIHTALVLFRNKLKYKINVVTELDESIAPIPCTSELHQVWTNLLSNAYDAIEQMGEDYSGEIVICARKTVDYAVVTITDNGIGIPEEKLKDIFDPFFTTKDIGKGTGLGLSIVSGIIKKHNGIIWAESRKGHTTFEVLLPLITTYVHGADQRIDESVNPKEQALQDSTVAPVI